MNLIDKMKEAQEESFDKWFERWHKKLNLENILIQSAQKGYSSFRITIKEATETGNYWDDERRYMARRMRDSKTAKSIKEKIGEGFKVTYISNVVEGTLFGIPTKRTEEYILIEWEVPE